VYTEPGQLVSSSKVAVGVGKIKNAGGNLASSSSSDESLADFFPFGGESLSARLLSPGLDRQQRKTPKAVGACLARPSPGGWLGYSPGCAGFLL